MLEHSGHEFFLVSSHHNQRAPKRTSLSSPSRRSPPRPSQRNSPQHSQLLPRGAEDRQSTLVQTCSTHTAQLSQPEYPNRPPSSSLHPMNAAMPAPMSSSEISPEPAAKNTRRSSNIRHDIFIQPNMATKTPRKVVRESHAATTCHERGPYVPTARPRRRRRQLSKRQLRVSRRSPWSPDSTWMKMRSMKPFNLTTEHNAATHVLHVEAET